jgi:hypothetical protein
MLLLDEFEQLVRKHFAFLSNELGFKEPSVENIAHRYRHLAYEKQNLVLEIAIETPDALPWWTAVRLINGKRPPAYGTDELGRTRRLYPHQIARAIPGHLVGDPPKAKDQALESRVLADADYMKRFVRYFLDHPDEVFDQVDLDRTRKPEPKLP